MKARLRRVLQACGVLLAGLIVAVTAPAAHGERGRASSEEFTLAGDVSLVREPLGRAVIEQHTERAVLRLADLRVEESETLTLLQPSPDSVLMVLVEGGNGPTQILGQVQAAGRVVLLDAAGVVFGPRATVEVGGLVAATGSVDVTRFMRGADELELSDMRAAVENRGRIQASDRGLVALLAPTVRNDGSIEVNEGRVALGVGTRASLRLSAGPALASIELGVGAVLDHDGRIRADGGDVMLLTAPDSGVARISGEIAADTSGSRVGRIILKGYDLEFDGRCFARSTASGSGGFVEVSALNELRFEGRVDTHGGVGIPGLMLIDPPTFRISNDPGTGSNINAQALTNNLAMGNVLISAFNLIVIDDPIDLSYSEAEQVPITNSLTLRAPVIDVKHHVNFGSGGLCLDASSVIHLDGVLTSAGNPMTAPQLIGGINLSPQVNVLSPSASLAQALLFVATGGTITIAPGAYHGNHAVARAVNLLGNPDDPLVPGASASAPTLFGTVPAGSIFEIDGVADVTIRGLALAADVDGQLEHRSTRGIEAVAADDLDIDNNSFDGFPVAGVDVRNASAVSITYNTFGHVGADAIFTSGLIDPDLHHNLLTDPPSVPIAPAGYLMGLAALLLVAGVIAVGRPR